MEREDNGLDDWDDDCTMMDNVGISAGVRTIQLGWTGFFFSISQNV